MKKCKFLSFFVTLLLLLSFRFLYSVVVSSFSGFYTGQRLWKGGPKAHRLLPWSMLVYSFRSGHPLLLLSYERRNTRQDCQCLPSLEALHPDRQVSVPESHHHRYLVLRVAFRVKCFFSSPCDSNMWLSWEPLSWVPPYHCLPMASVLPEPS